MKEQLELWKAWKKNPSNENLKKLLASFQPMVSSFALRFKNPILTQPILEAEGKRLLIEAFKRYNPRKGKLSTFCYNYLKKMRRFVLKHQNVFDLPESQGLAIARLQEAELALEEKLNRKPSIEELANELGWSKNRVAVIKSLMEGAIPESTLLYPAAFPLGERATVEAIYNKLNPQEKLVFEYLTGYMRKPVSSLKRLAKITKIPYPKLKIIKQNIKKKIREFVK